MRGVHDLLKRSGAVDTTRFIIEVDLLNLATDEDKKKMFDDFKNAIMSVVWNNKCCVAIRPREVNNLEAMEDSLAKG